MVNKAVILEDSAFFKRGQIISDYKKSEDGLLFEGKFVNDEKVVYLTETLSANDEVRIREIIRQQLKALFYNLYTKQSFII